MTEHPTVWHGWRSRWLANIHQYIMATLCWDIAAVLRDVYNPQAGKFPAGSPRDQKSSEVTTGRLGGGAKASPGGGRLSRRLRRARNSVSFPRIGRTATDQNRLASCLSGEHGEVRTMCQLKEASWYVALCVFEFAAEFPVCFKSVNIPTWSGTYFFFLSPLLRGGFFSSSASRSWRWCGESRFSIFRLVPIGDASPIAIRAVVSAADTFQF